MELFTPIWKTKDDRKIPAAIEKINRIDDVHVLIKITSQAYSRKIRETAADRIMLVFNPADITQVRMIIGKFRFDEDYCNDVLSRCSNDILLPLYFDDQEYSIYVAKHITDQSALIAIAERMEGKYWKTAFESITDDRFLRRMIFETKDERRICALKSIDDHDLIIDFASNCEDWNMRLAAFRRIDDPQTSDDVIKNILGKTEQGQSYDESLVKMIEHHDRLLCSRYSSSMLTYVDPFNGSRVTYQANIYDLDDHQAYTITFRNHILKDVFHNEQLKVCFPDAMVAVTDSVSEDDLLICPICSGRRNNRTYFIKECKCCSRLSAVRLEYSEHEY